MHNPRNVIKSIRGGGGKQRMTIVRATQEVIEDEDEEAKE